MMCSLIQLYCFVGEPCVTTFLTTDPSSYPTNKINGDHGVAINSQQGRVTVITITVSDSHGLTKYKSGVQIEAIVLSDVYVYGEG